MTTDTNTRTQAALQLEHWLRTGDFPNRQLDSLEHDRSVLVEMVQGVVRWKRTLEWISERWIRRTPDPVVQAFLWVGLYQLVFMDDVAGYAAVNETVAGAKVVCGRKVADFVNALLRRAAEDPARLREAVKAAPLGIRCSHPDLLCQRWQARWGVAATEQLCEWNNGRPEVWIRLNSLRVSRDLFVQGAMPDGAEHGVEATDMPDCFRVLKGVAIPRIPGYAEGWFWVMDPAAARAVDALAPRAGERILDACAAPGGKTALIACRMAGQGALVAMDMHEDRRVRLRDNLQRLGLKNWVQVVCGDLTQPWNDADAAAGFDGVLVDVPCSNTGVIRRKPDVRWRFSLPRLLALAETQRRLLTHASALVKPGGRVVYSTCSLEREENEDLVASWLRANPDFTLIHELRSFPPESRHDGAYAVVMKRKE